MTILLLLDFIRFIAMKRANVGVVVRTDRQAKRRAYKFRSI